MTRREVALLLGLAALFAVSGRSERRLLAELEDERAFANAVAWEAESMLMETKQIQGDPR